MTIDCNRYRAVLPIFTDWIERSGHIDEKEQMARLIQMTDCPAIVVACYMVKIKGPSIFLNHQIAQLTKFYSYDIVILPTEA